jgi:HEAT repeat protein
VEAVAFLEALVRGLGRGWSARYGVIAPYGVLGVTLTSDTGGTAEVVPSLVRGLVVTWSPFVFTPGTPHYDVYTDDGVLTRTAVLAEAIAGLDRWRRSRGAVGQVAARLARAGARRRRAVRTTEVDSAPPIGALPPRFTVTLPPLPPLADVLRGKKLGEIKRARELAAQRDPAAAAGELLAIARRATGDARANALGVLVAIARPQDGAELARYLDDPERSVQRVAIDGVKRTGYAPAVPALAALVLGRDGKATSMRSQLATAAATAMKVLSGRRGAAALTGYFSSEDPRVREAACVAFTLFANPGTKQARPLLERLLGDGDARVAKAARRALAAR